MSALPPPEPAWRILVGGVTHGAALLRVEGPEGPPIPRCEPAGPRVGGAVRVPGTAKPTWEVQITGLQPATTYQLLLDDAGALLVQNAEIRTAPATLGADDGLLLGFTSCYYPSDTFEFIPCKILQCLNRRDFRPSGQPPESPRALPAAFFHLGDQIYADVAGGLNGQPEAIFAAKYAKNWSSRRLGAVLRKGGHFFTPDDHEYWNGFPEWMPWLGPTDAARWQGVKQVAQEAFWREQGQWNFVDGFQGGKSSRLGWGDGLLGDLPFFITDTRSERTSRDGKRDPALPATAPPAPGGAKRFCSDQQLTALGSWLASPSRVCLLVLPQPLLMDGNAYDSGLEDYAADYERLLRMLGEAVRRGKTVIVVAGDIHWGRLCQFSRQDGGPGRLIEFVVSPLARLSAGIGAVLNLFSEHTAVGKPKSPDHTATLASLDAARRLRERWPDLRLEFHFATGENQLGLLHLFADPSGQRVARFELWNLTHLPEVEPAVNRWGGALVSCVHEIPLGP